MLMVLRIQAVGWYGMEFQGTGNQSKHLTGLRGGRTGSLRDRVAKVCLIFPVGITQQQGW